MAGKTNQIGCTLDYTDKPLIMGIVNVTPDSFSDGGDNFCAETAAATALSMESAGADIIDIGAESTRPGSEPVTEDEQLRRAIPVISGLKDRLGIPISIDTCSAVVARECLEAGAAIINDISGGSDPEMFRLAAEINCPIVIMHMQGMPKTMQKNPRYEDVVSEVLGYLLGRALDAESAGVNKDNIIIDPGIGFGKSLEHNIALLKGLHCFTGSTYRVLLGASRKSFIGTVTGETNPKKRLAGTLVTTAAAVCAGVDIIRVHDVADNAAAVKIAKLIL
ncbi:Dihydropteroate synthase [Limihaloglobus sulfuriphilus]|uniref:Dihydropteroate synthase n=1 Tax=Limihaloglobus sulfuriphilus TaxID=1851148 RepID=A0A1Q2MDY7_9BACT|nr:dihydropteroate synthase [Limihaloglobus sulfuriphilus]AQQ70905.1 Dihydropteroate synthase [Limihaloglobus sulfuriphilus]